MTCNKLSSKATAAKFLAHLRMKEEVMFELQLVAQDISDRESIFVHPRVPCWSPRVVHGQCGSHVQVRVGGEGDQQNKDPQQEG